MNSLSTSNQEILKRVGTLLRDASTRLTVEKKDRISHVAGEFYFMYHDDGENRLAFKSRENAETFGEKMRDATDSLLAITSSRSETGREEHAVDVRFLEIVLEGFVIRLATGKISSEELPSELQLFILEKYRYVFPFVIYFGSMKDERIDFGAVIFWKNSDAFEQNTPKAASVWQKKFDEEERQFAVMQVDMTYNNDAGTAYRMAYDIAKTHLACLQFIGMTKVNHVFGIPLSLEKERNADHVYVRDGKVEVLASKFGYYTASIIGYDIDELAQTKYGVMLNNRLKENIGEDEILRAIVWLSKSGEEDGRSNQILFLWAALESLIERGRTVNHAKTEYEKIYGEKDAGIIDTMYQYRNLIHGGMPHGTYISSIYCQIFADFVARLIRKKLDAANKLSS